MSFITNSRFCGKEEGWVHAPGPHPQIHPWHSLAIARAPKFPLLLSHWQQSKCLLNLATYCLTFSALISTFSLTLSLFFFYVWCRRYVHSLLKLYSRLLISRSRGPCNRPLYCRRSRCSSLDLFPALLLLLSRLLYSKLSIRSTLHLCLSWGLQGDGGFVSCH